MNYPWQGEQNRLTDYDLPRLGHTIGVGEDIIHMLLEVESRGKGYDSEGVTKLFEKHVFYRNLPNALKQKAVALKLATKNWKNDYKNNHNTFLKAYAFDKEAALKACSLGFGQVLGENHKLIGYDTVEDMVKAFAESEHNQLEGMIAFIKANNIDDELREMEKTNSYNVLLKYAHIVARVYNGPAYKKHNYHGRLVKSLLKWRKIRDTKWSPNDADYESAVADIQEKRNDPIAKEQNGIIDFIASIFR